MNALFVWEWVVAHLTWPQSVGLAFRLLTVRSNGRRAVLVVHRQKVTIEGLNRVDVVELLPPSGLADELGFKFAWEPSAVVAAVRCCTAPMLHTTLR